MRVCFYTPIGNYYNHITISISTLNGYNMDSSNELIFDFSNNKVYMNDIDVTFSILDAEYGFSSISQITVIKIGY